ncbi:MAG: hypothetical protein JWO88_3527 [Frankiales bacterium]|nr:hypothetical protein [Frankiales bacterium]
MLRRWAPLAAAVSVVAIVVAVSLAFHRSSSGSPPPLRLAAASGTDSAMSAAAPAQGKLAAGGSSFVLAGPLPTGPSEARAQTLPRGAANADEVRRLADALGVTATPRRVDAAWQAGALRVEDAAGHPWSLSGCAPDVPVGSGGMADCIAGYGGTGNASVGSGSAPAATSVGPAAPEPGLSPCPPNARCAKPDWVAPAPPMPSPLPPVDVLAARHAADVVLHDLGLADADVSVEPAGDRAFVRADPRVAGLPTSGYATQLEIDAEGKVVGGSGYLGRSSTGPSYPLVSAKAAFDALPEQPRLMMACPSTADCPPPAPAKVTGAELGLQLTALADDEAALLPAWLFTVTDWPAPLAQPAIEPRFLTLPSAEPGPVASDQPAPGEPAPAPSTARSAFSFDTVFPTDDPKTVIVQYGDSGSCPHTHVTHLAKESADSVFVNLEGDTQPADQACTADYRQMLAPVGLQSPLGNRTVIDASTGKPVTIDRSCARPMGEPVPPKSCGG